MPEILAGDLPESKRGVLGGGQTGEQQDSNQEAPPEQASSAAGARGGRAEKTKPRPNVEVNRRAEGTSGLNRRLGAGGRMDVTHKTRRLQGGDELVSRHLGLAQDTSQCAHFYLAVQWDDAALGATAHDDVAYGLAQLLKTQPLQRPNEGSARNVRQLRHALER